MPLAAGPTVIRLVFFAFIPGAHAPRCHWSFSGLIRSLNYAWQATPRYAAFTYRLSQSGHHGTPKA